MNHTQDSIVSVFHSFFGRIWDFIICFRDLLTFRNPTTLATLMRVQSSGQKKEKGGSSPIFMMAHGGLVRIIITHSLHSQQASRDQRGKPCTLPPYLTLHVTRLYYIPCQPDVMLRGRSLTALIIFSPLLTTYLQLKLGK